MIQPLSHTYSDLDKRKEYNNNIETVPARFKDYYLPGQKILIKMFKFTKQTTTANGVINAKMLEKVSEGGRPTAKLDQFVYQNRGVIVYTSPEAQKFIKENFEQPEKFTPGAIVWMDPKYMNNTFFHSPEHPIQEDHDYVIVHPNHLQNIEPTTLEIKFTL